MAYISTEQRTQVLIETIEDAEKFVGTIDLQVITEKQAHRLAVAFSHVLATAKRHPYWPEPEEPKTAIDTEVKAEVA